MTGFFLNTVVSAVVGALAAFGVTWYASAQSDAGKLATSGSELTKVQKLEVESLVVKDSLLLIDPKTHEPLVEICDGKVFAQSGVYTDHVGAWRMTAQKLQTTPEDPLDPQSAIFGEIAVSQDGGGYLELLSPKETHTLTMGFNASEKGCVISQNNEDQAQAAQAIFIKPTQNNRGTGVLPASGATPAPTRSVERPNFDSNGPSGASDFIPGPADLDSIDYDSAGRY